MKKFLASALIILTALSLFACSSEKDTDIPTTDSKDNIEISEVKALETGIKDIFDADEDAAYHDLFHNKNYSAYENKSFTKYGIFTPIYDAYNQVTRYYVWGYGDEGKGCCYQWEFVLPENTDIPSAGSVVTVTGKMTASDKALDGYWLTDASLTVNEEHEKSDAQYDITAMSPTLARVQITNMLHKPDAFRGVSVRLAGKVSHHNSVVCAYTESSWSIHFTNDGNEFEENTFIIIDGIFNTEENEGIITSEKITAEK